MLSIVVDHFERLKDPKRASEGDYEDARCNLRLVGFIFGFSS